MSFKSWLNQVNATMMSRYDMLTSDLPDEDYYMHWESGITYSQMVKIISINNSLCVN